MITYAYPPSSDVGPSMLAIVNFIEGITPVVDAANAAWTLLGCGLAVGLPPTPPPSGIMAATAATETKAALKTAITAVNAGRMGTVNWLQILQIAMQILQQILAGGGKST